MYLLFVMVLDSYNVNMTLITPNYTDRLQLLGYSVNKAGEDFYVANSENGMQSKCEHNLKVVRTRW